MSTDIHHPAHQNIREIRARQREMSRKLREARNLISSKSRNGTEFETDRLKMFIANEQGVAIAVSILAVLAAMTCAIWAPFYEALLWLSAVLITKGVFLIICRRASLKENRTQKTDNRRSRILIAEFIHGVAWAHMIALSIETSNYPAHLFIVSSILIYIALRMISAAAIPRIALAGTLPLTIALVIHCLLSGEQIYWAIAASVVLIHFIFIMFVRNLHQHILSMLAYRAEKDYLIAEIEEEKSFSDEARKHAEKANIAKSRFLAAMSHELRTPLNAILGFSEIMKDEIFGKHDNPSYREYASDIHESGSHLLHLINEILDLSRIEAGRYTLKEDYFRISDISLECCRLLKLKAEKKGIQIAENYNDLQTSFWGDEKAIRQVILNILSNAIKFTPCDGSVTVTITEQQDGSLRLSIRDTGPGIPEDEIPHIMTNFGQGSLAHQIAEGGSGLGIPIVRGLVKMHNGLFEIQSEPRKGTEIIIILPASRTTRMRQQTPVSPPVSIENQARMPESDDLAHNISQRINVA